MSTLRLLMAVGGFTLILSLGEFASNASMVMNYSMDDNTNPCQQGPSIKFSFSNPNILANNICSVPSSFIKSHIFVVAEKSLPSDVNKIIIAGFIITDSINDGKIQNNASKFISGTFIVNSLKKNFKSDKIKPSCSSKRTYSKHIISNDSSVRMFSHLRGDLDSSVFYSLAEEYAEKISQWVKSRDFKLMEQLGEGATRNIYTNYIESPLAVYIYSTAYLPDTIRLVSFNPFTLKRRLRYESIDKLTELKEGSFYLTDDLLQKGDSVFVGVAFDNSRRKFKAKVSIIDLRDPDKNHRSMKMMNDSVTMESWINPKDTRLSILSDKYGKIIAERIDWLRSHTLTPDPIAPENRWFDFLIVPPNVTDK